MLSQQLGQVKPCALSSLYLVISLMHNQVSEHYLYYYNYVGNVIKKTCHCNYYTVFFPYLIMCRFVKDKVNFGLNTDDPGLIYTTLSKEFQSAQSDLGLTEEQLIETVYNAARSCFLPDDEKLELIKEIDEKIDEYKKNKNKQ